MALQGCSVRNKVVVEEICGFKVKTKINFLEEHENWMFGGDGHKTTIYSINPENLNYILYNARLNNFEPFDNSNNPFPNYEIKPYIKNGRGLYKSIFEENVYKSVLIDSVNQKLIYSICIL